MQEYVLRTNLLNKQYKKIYVLKDININIKEGQIYALIGKNGAGKTTLLRLIAGLSGKTTGTIELFGETEEDKLNKSRRKIGWLIETPALYLNKTAYENLEIERIHKGIHEKESIEKVLDIVGLKDIKSKKTRDFSLGMKQRLGIAMALIGNPKLLVLDEPTNGLDPVGIIEMRKLLKKLNQEHGITILISSHILSELSQIADCYGFINNCRLIEEITSEDINKKYKKFITIKSDNVEKTKNILKTKLHTSHFKEGKDKLIYLYDYYTEPGKVASILHENGVTVEEIICKREDLENYYINLLERK